VTDADLEGLLETVLRSSTPSRTIVAGPHPLAESKRAEATFARLVAVATRRLGAPAFDDRSDRAAIDTWDPSARRLTAWPHAEGLVFVSLEENDTASTVLVGYASDDEITARRRHRGHTPPDTAAAPAAEPAATPRADALLGLDLRNLRGRPPGLNPLSRRRRDRALRWLLLLALVGFLVAFFGILIVAHRAAG
jgi:hypothetical protein